MTAQRTLPHGGHGALETCGAAGGQGAPRPELQGQRCAVTGSPGFLDSAVACDLPSPRMLERQRLPGACGMCAEVLAGRQGWPGRTAGPAAGLRAPCPLLCPRTPCLKLCWVVCSSSYLSTAHVFKKEGRENFQMTLKSIQLFISIQNSCGPSTAEGFALVKSVARLCSVRGSPLTVALQGVGVSEEVGTALVVRDHGLTYRTLGWAAMVN